jgi:hypothetical protein
MPISGTYFIKKWIPEPRLVHGEDFHPVPPHGFEGLGGPGGPGGPSGAPGGPPPGAPKWEVDLPDYGKPCEGFFEGEMTLVLEAQSDGTLKGTANGDPINFGYYTGDEYFKVDYPAGPGRWEVWARVDGDGTVKGMISVGGGGGFPNFAYGKKIG